MTAGRPTGEHVRMESHPEEMPDFVKPHLQVSVHITLADSRAFSHHDFNLLYQNIYTAYTQAPSLRSH